MLPILQDGTYRPDTAIDEIADFIADPVKAADFPQTILRFRNDKAARQVGLADLSDAAWIGHFGRFAPLPDNQPQPLALRYHGHQFRIYNPDIGDGRGFLFAQMRDSAGRLMDLGTKGSGQTPYSRFGDGRLTLKGAVREVLATEMLEALCVPTSRTFSVIETGEQLHRGDEPSPTRSAVLVRLNHGNIRIGSFQRLAALRLHEETRRLVTYTLRHYFNEEAGPDAPARLLALVAERTAKLSASYMIAGFVHGVLNSDNINVSGESFDYGPWRWNPTWNPGFTAASFDESGLYAFGRQAEAIHWDTVQLANALLPISTEDALISALDGYADVYQTQMARHFCWRLGVTGRSAEQDQALTQAGLKALSASQTGIDAFFHDWRGGALRKAGHTDRYPDEFFGEFRQLAADFDSIQPSAKGWWAREKPCSMLIGEVETIWSPIASDDDWSLFNGKILEIREMGQNLNPERIEW